MQLLIGDSMFIKEYFLEIFIELLLKILVVRKAVTYIETYSCCVYSNHCPPEIELGNIKESN